MGEFRRHGPALALKLGFPGKFGAGGSSVRSKHEPHARITERDSHFGLRDAPGRPPAVCLCAQPSWSQNRSNMGHGVSSWDAGGQFQGTSVRYFGGSPHYAHSGDAGRSCPGLGPNQSNLADVARLWSNRGPKFAKFTPSGQFWLTSVELDLIWPDPALARTRADLAQFRPILARTRPGVLRMAPRLGDLDQLCAL